MNYTELGRTGLRVSVAGLGCGGFSRLGKAQGKTEAESIAVVRAALDAGINFLDTAAVYGTETIVGKALQAHGRDSAIVSTKALITRGDTPRPVSDIVQSLDDSLKALQTDCVDIFHLHGVPPSAFDFALNEVVPALKREQEAGKFRFLGITETAPNDPKHVTLSRSLEADCFDVMMIAFHMLHQSAREQLFPLTRERNVGTLIMFAVRVIFSQPQRLRDALSRLAKAGELSTEIANDPEPLAFLIHDGGAHDVIDAAYRYCRHQPGSDVVLFGTGSKAHLDANIASINRPPLPKSDVAKLYELFGHLVGVGLDKP